MPVNPLIEQFAQTQMMYIQVFEDQAAILRTDPVVCREAYDNVCNSEGIGKVGEHWMPKDEERGAYMRHLESICSMEPKTADERVKICFAARAFLGCFILFDLSKLSTAEPLKISTRVNELQTAELAKLPACMPPHPMPEPALPALQIYAPTQMHQPTEKKLQDFFENPLDLLGKRFMLKGDHLRYEIVKFGTSKGKGHYYGVQYADCVSAVEMDTEGLKMHLQESYLIDG